MTLLLQDLPLCFRTQFPYRSGGRNLVEQAVGGPVEDAYIVNALDMPLFQFLHPARRASAERRRPQTLPLLELILVNPAFALQPTHQLTICIRWFAKKPKQLPQLRQLHLPLAVPADDPSRLTLRFRLMSGEVLGSCVVSTPWFCDFEVLSSQLGVDMKLVYVLMTVSVKESLSWEALAKAGNEEALHVGGLVFIKPGSLDLECVRKRVVNLRTTLEPANMPNGWRRWYHEFKSLTASLPLEPFEIVTSDGTPQTIVARFGEAQVLGLAHLIFQAFAFSRRRAEQEQICRRLQR